MTLSVVLVTANNKDNTTPIHTPDHHSRVTSHKFFFWLCHCLRLAPRICIVLFVYQDSHFAFFVWFIVFTQSHCCHFPCQRVSLRKNNATCIIHAVSTSSSSPIALCAFYYANRAKSSSELGVYWVALCSVQCLNVSITHCVAECEGNLYDMGPSKLLHNPRLCKYVITIRQS